MGSRYAAAWLIAAALLMTTACTRPQPFGEDIWKAVRYTDVAP